MLKSYVIGARLVDFIGDFHFEETFFLQFCLYAVADRFDRELLKIDRIPVDNRKGTGIIGCCRFQVIDAEFCRTFFFFFADRKNYPVIAYFVCDLRMG